jgi:endogenous inhibitor of DNA gyrase (YacG/DUF329 family)
MEQIDESNKRLSKLVITNAAESNAFAVTCAHCKKRMARIEEETDRMVPSPEALSENGAVAVPNFGWFCSQQCGEDFENESGVQFQRISEGEISYY